MTNQERFEYFESGKLQRMVEIELLDWAGYWTTAGTESITDPLQRKQTDEMILLILRVLSECIKQVSCLVISYDEIKTFIGDPSETIVHNIVTNILTFKLAWLTGITELPIQFNN